MRYRSDEPLRFEPGHLAEYNALKWGFGAGVPLALLGVGLWIIVREAITFTITGRGSSLVITLSGFDAVVVGMLFVFGAMYVHMHCWWANSPRLSDYAEGGKALALLGVLLSLSYSVFASIRFVMVH